MGLNDILNKATGKDLTGDQIKLTVAHHNDEKRIRIDSIIRTASDIEELYRQGKIGDVDRDMLYLEIKNHIEDSDRGLGGITGVLDPKVVTDYESKNRK